MYGKGTVVQVVEPVDFDRWDCVMHRTYIVESAVEAPPAEQPLGEEFEPFYFLNNDVTASDGAAYTAPAWAVMAL